MKIKMIYWGNTGAQVEMNIIQFQIFSHNKTFYYQKSLKISRPSPCRTMKNILICFNKKLYRSQKTFVMS